MGVDPRRRQTPLPELRCDWRLNAVPPSINSISRDLESSQIVPIRSINKNLARSYEAYGGLNVFFGLHLSIDRLTGSIPNQSRGTRMAKTLLKAGQLRGPKLTEEASSLSMAVWREMGGLRKVATGSRIEPVNPIPRGFGKSGGTAKKPK
jgi:hypothetical protein